MDLADKIKANLENRHTEPRNLLHPALSWQIVGAAIEVHKRVGPGQLERVYERSLHCELRQRGLVVQTQVPIPMFYKGEHVGEHYADLVVENAVILELKSVDRLHRVHTAQVLSYLSAADLRLGILLNFNVTRMIDGVKRVVR